MFGGCSCGDEQLRQLEECEIPSNHERPETCNDRDDDCDCPGDTDGDGVVCGPGDDGVDEGCDDDGDGFCDGEVEVEGRPGICPRSFDHCAADGRTCTAFVADCDDDDADVNPGAAERCNGRDDDCDAKVDLDDPTIDDERIGVPCNDGTLPPEKAGIGTCTRGAQTCESGAIVCRGTVGPVDEDCDGKDNDCNGLTDDGEANYRLCSSANNPLVGECRPGFHLCRNGRWDTSVCIDEVLPTQEVCDGRDQDCDGTPDNGARSDVPVYVTFHLDCSGSMSDKISAILAFLNALDTLPAIYFSSQIKFALVLHPDGSGQLPWVHRTFADVAAFRTSLATVNTASCGWLEPNLDSVAFGMCSSRPTSEWASSSQCRSLYDGEWNRCGGANGNPSAHPAGTICRSVLTGGYLNGRILDLPVPDEAHQLHVLLTDEEAQTNVGLTAPEVSDVKTDLITRYASANWDGKIRVACFLSSSYASQFAPFCDATYNLSSGSTSVGIMADFTRELESLYCQ